MTATSDQTYATARGQYAALGVDTDQAIRTLAATPISINCWQGDDVQGFEHPAEGLSTGGIQVTGGYPGRARTIAELQADLAKALSLIPGRHRVNLHAMYGEFGGKRVDRDAIDISHFRGWVDWARSISVQLDFNATCFAHERAESGFTLSSTDRATREFWIEHVRRCRDISADIGTLQGGPCIHNLWIPDGSKDHTVSRALHRDHLKNSLDTLFAKAYDRSLLKDAVEGKLFGIGSEAFVVGSHEFYLAYALTHGTMLCIDMGHFHPTESVADKVSAIFPFCPELLFHVSRGVRWDSDHVVTFNDETLALMQEIVRGGYLKKVNLALDFFDASINRVGAWVIGTRATQRALLAALLEPTDRLRALEAEGNLFGRLALLEDMKAMPLGAVWERFCLSQGVPVGADWHEEILRYEREILRQRM